MQTKFNEFSLHFCSACRMEIAQFALRNVCHPWFAKAMTASLGAVGAGQASSSTTTTASDESFLVAVPLHPAVTAMLEMQSTRPLALVTISLKASVDTS